MDLRHKLGHAGEAHDVSKPLNQVDPQGGAGQISHRHKQVNLSGGGPTHGGPRTEMHDTWQLLEMRALSAAEDIDPHCIHTVTRQSLGEPGQVGGGKPQSSASPIARYDHTGDHMGSTQDGAGLSNPSRDQSLTHPTAREHTVFIAHQRHGVMGETKLSAEALEQPTISRPIVAEPEILPHYHVTGAEPAHQDLPYEIFCRQGSKSLIEGLDDHGEFGGKPEQELEFARSWSEDQRSFSPQRMGGMGFERQNDRRKLFPASQLESGRHQILVPPMNAVEIADCHGDPARMLRKLAIVGKDTLHRRGPSTTRMGGELGRSSWYDVPRTPMHEYSLVLSLIERVEQEARRNHAKLVKRVAVRLGELSGVEAELFEYAYEMARTGTLCASAELVVTRVPAVFRCSHCDRVLDHRVSLECSECSAAGRLSEGDDIMFDQMEIEV